MESSTESATNGSKMKDAALLGGSSMLDGSSTMFGTERQVHESIKPTLGSFPRSVGPAADIRELEYISSLHQNAATFLRLDGTISSKDIAPYLMSRYGMEITPAHAIDIAVNLCGAKPRSALLAEKDAQAEEEVAQDDNQLALPEILEVVEQKDDEEEQVYYFDLVQLMALLLVPELVQLSDRHSNNSGDKESLKALDVGASSTMGTEKGGIFDLVIKSITEVFDERVQQDIRSGRRALDKELLARMLEAFGDIDAANDEQLLTQMLNALGGEGAFLTADTFMNALTADVRTYSSKKNTAPDEETLMQTSTFYDIYGRNWEDKEDPENPGDMGEAPKPIKTASFIDYAVDTYGSVVLNTAVWSLFILTTLIYLNLFLTMIDSNTGGVFCPPDDGFGCAIANKVFGWILTAFFCGFYGVFFIVPTSIGNVQGNTPMLYLTLVVTALYSYVPFATLMWHRQGIPHNTETVDHYRVICPKWITNNITELREIQAQFKLNEDAAQNYLLLDSSCLRAVDWCNSHPEIQGKYIDQSPTFLSYDEFERCYSYYLEKVDSYYVDKVEDFLWTQTGKECDVFRATCPRNGECGLKSLSYANDTLGEDYVCCHSGHAVYFESTRYQDAGLDSAVDLVANVVCDDQPAGAPCLTSSMCEGDTVCDNTTSVCFLPEGVEETTGLLGSLCGRQNSNCESDFCWNGTCQEHPTICPKEGLEALGGFKLDPFCRTFDQWCEYTNVFRFQAAFKTYLNIDLVSRDICAQVLDQAISENLVVNISLAEAEIGYSQTFQYNTHVEETLLNYWAVFVLLSIAVVGFFALLSILSKLIAANNGDRPRDFHIKCAAATKISNVVENAIGLHKQGVRAKGRVMRNYFLRGERKVEVGGLVWTVKRLWSGHLSSKEGVRYPGRIWVGLVTQIVVTIIGIFAASELIVSTGESIDEERQELSRSYTQADVDNISTFDWATTTLDDLTVTEEEQLQLDAIPERWMWDAAAIPGAVAGSLVAIFCILVYIPSTTNTVMKLRNGQLPSLHDPYFNSYRKTPDNVVQNIGNMVFSLMGAAVVMSVLAFSIVFVFTYSVTRKYAVDYVATAIGILCTMVIKIVGQKILRARNFSSFYRKKPKSANYFNLFFECWYIGTGLLVVISRLIMFLLSGALWLGRIDVEFLHPDVKVVGVGLDKIPVSFKRDILVHEAHIHPYIERLGSMYLLRLRDGDGFGSVVGTTWRCLFVSGLMPWIVKHKVNANEEASLNKAVEDDRLSSRRLIHVESTQTGCSV